MRGVGCCSCHRHCHLREVRINSGKVLVTTTTVEREHIFHLQTRIFDELSQLNVRPEVVLFLLLLHEAPPAIYFNEI
jgi:hypothetical protein